MYGFYSFWDGPGLRAGVGAADFLHVRHPIPQSRSAPAGGWNPRPRSWPWSWRGAGKSGRHSSMFALSGPEGVRPRPGRVVGESGWGGGVPVRRDPGACLPDKAGVCLSGSRGGQSDADTGVGRPESGGADECRAAFGLPAGKCGCCHPNRDVGLPERDACCGCGRSAVLARKNEGSPERLPSPSKINP